MDFVLHVNKGILVEREKAHFLRSETVASNLEEFEAYLTENKPDTNMKTAIQVVTLPTGPQSNSESTIVWRVHHALIEGLSSRLAISRLRAATAGMRIPEGLSLLELPERWVDTKQVPKRPEGCSGSEFIKSMRWPRASLSWLVQRHFLLPS